MRRALLLVAVIGVASCSGSSDPTTTTAQSGQTTETTAPTTVTSPPTSSVTTTTTVPPGEIEYPEAPDTVDDLPDALTSYLGAPMPIPDLSIDGPDDLDLWMAGWLDWLAWVNANPAEGAEELSVNLVPGSEQFEDIRTALLDRAAANQQLLGGGFIPTSLSGSFDEFFGDKTALRIVMIAGGPPSYLIDEAGEVISVFAGLDGQVTVSALLRYVTERDEWVMETFEVLGRS